MKKVISSLIICTIGALGILPVTPASAATNRFGLLYMRPVPDGGAYFTVFDSQSLQALQFNLGTALDYAYRPLTGATAGVVNNITKYYAAAHVYGAFGITDWWSLFADMPVIAYNRFANPDIIPLPAPTNITKIGDLELGMKFRLLNKDGARVGIAIVPTMTIPTGSEYSFMGDSGVTGGGLLVIDGRLADWFDWSINVGALGRKHVQTFGPDFKSQFLLSGAAGFNVATWASLIGELSTRTPFNNFYQSRSTSLLDALFGVQWRIGDEQRLKLNTSAGVGSPYGTGAPQIRAMASLSYTLAPIGSHQKPTEHVADVVAVPWSPILFGFGSTRLSSKATHTLDQIGSDLKKNPHPVVATGYTDSTGKKSYNQKLSKMRARAVKGYLQRQGLASENVTAVGKGANNFAASNSTAEGRAQNRRVEVKDDKLLRPDHVQ